MKKLFLMAVMAASIAQAGLDVNRVVRGAQRPSDYVVTNVSISGVVWTTDATYTATVARASSAYAWGDHSAAGYLASSVWLSWLSTNTYVKVETDATALAALESYAQTNRLTRLYNPTNSSEYIDGALNRYVVSNLWEMTLSPEVRDAYDRYPTTTNLTFTQYGEFYETIGDGFTASSWTFGWSQADGFYVRQAISMSGNQYLATTNSYVLDSEWAGYGTVYIRPYSTTNLIGMLASTADLASYIPLSGGTFAADSVLQFPVPWHNPEKLIFGGSGVQRFDPPFVDATYDLPEGDWMDEEAGPDGEFTFASREWVRQFSATNASGISAETATNIAQAVTADRPTFAQTTNIVLSLQQFSLTLYGYASVTSTVAGANMLTNALPSGPLATVTNLNTTTGAYVAKFITQTGQRFSRIAQGVINVRFHARKGAAGALTLKPEVYILDENGATVTEYETASSTTPLTTLSTEYNIDVPIPSNAVFTASNRLGVYIKATVTSGSPDVYVDTENSVNFVVSVPVPSSDFVTQSQLANYTTQQQVTNIVNSMSVSSSGAPLAWTPVLSVASASVATAIVTTAKSIFYFESSEAVSFTNDLSQLSLSCGTNYAWTIVFNATGTNACNSTNWYGVVDFVGFTPEITCTGRYEYACETSCGRIKIRQTYPTVYPWVNMPLPSTANTLDTVIGGKTYLIVIPNSASSGFFSSVIPSSAPCLISSSVYFSANWDKTNSTFKTAINGVSVLSNIGPYVTNSVPTDIRKDFYTSTHYIEPVNTRTPAFKFSWIRESNPSASIVATMLKAKQANENEKIAGTNKTAWASAYQF